MEKMELIRMELEGRGFANVEEVCNTLAAFQTYRMFDTYGRAVGITYRTLSLVRGVSQKSIWMNATSYRSIRRNVDFKKLSPSDKKLVFDFWNLS